MRLLIAATLVALAAPVSAQDEGTALAQAGERGRTMFAYDRAAWLGTDDMIAKVPNPADKVAGYIVEGPADAPRLIFFDKGVVPQAVYIARFSLGDLVGSKVMGAGDDRTIAPQTQRMIAALSIARKALSSAADVAPCEPVPFNTVVLPPTTPDAVVPVYFMTPQRTKDRIPFGGHFEVDVAADGVAGPIRRFANSCLTTPMKPPGQAKGAAVVVSHLRDPIPTEIHVFTSLAIGLPVMVATMQPKPRLWPVASGRIGRPTDLKQ